MIEAGTLIDRWEVVRRVGSGGMAEVYEVRHAALGSRHALKLLHPGATPVVDRLLGEGRIQATLEHENIVRVTDMIRFGDRPALVMEYIDGPTLGEWLAPGRPWDEVERLFRGVIAGVEAAHARGIVHRDLKPANVLLATVGGVLVPKVTDFGIAKADEGETRPGSTLGTLRYMAPEQMRDASTVDRRADVWALGCLLYQGATGRPPFDGTDPIALYEACVHRRYPDPASLAPGLPAPVLRAIAAALEPDRERRLPDVAALRAVLDGAIPADVPSTWDEGQAVADLAIGAPMGASGGRERFAATRLGVPGELTVEAQGAPPSVRERLVREARVLAELDHPRIAAFLGAGHLPDGRAWLFRAPVAGQPLGEWARRRRPQEEIHALVGELLAVASWLHSLSPPVVVREWSLQAIRVGPRGAVLVDLPLVLDAPQDPVLGGLTFDEGGGIAAPEQLAGDASPATDVWGIAALATALFSRSAPAGMRAGERPDLRAAADLPEAWVAALDAMLADSASERPSAAVAAARWASLVAPTPARRPALAAPMADRAEPSVREAPVLDRPPIEDLTFGAPLTRHVSASPAAPVRATGWRSWVTAVATIVTLVVGIPLFSTGVARVIMALEAPSAEPSGRLLQDVVERLDRDRGVQACGVASGATLDIPLTVGADLGVHFPNPPAPPIERCLAERLTQLVDAARPDGVAHPTVLHLTSTPLMRDRRVEPANDAATQSCFRYFATRDAWRRGWRGVVSAAEPGGERSVDVTIHGVDHPELGRCLTETGAFDPRVDPPIVGNVGDLPGTR